MTELAEAGALAAASTSGPGTLRPHDSPGPPLQDTLRTAQAAAQAAARSAGVGIRQLRELADLQLAVDLFGSVWRPEPTNPPITRDLLRALGKAGNYIGGAFRDTELVGGCVGFFGPPGQAAMHSHLAGVAATVRGRQVGFALKLDQRAWALRHGVVRISWTFDPLLCRNAYFNLGKLAATATEYAVDFYGLMYDAINGNTESDRLLVDWHLGSAPVVRACDAAVTGQAPAAGGAARWVGDGDPAGQLAALRGQGACTALSAGQRAEPVTGPIAGRLVLVGIPPDMERLRRTDPATARAWRLALREVLGGLLRDGWQVVGFVRTGWYVLGR